ncbi:tape measure protein [Acidovorax sp. Be4]|uniref:Tape measure protein n=1 Tax=Acidovorax bellezanensis TaxID=2976702 RepID=A0ABT2PPM5_9BURK|nr:tape measure protein [Acidovorax sp. Be4]MCT9812414.1 tape measure protein [Acidovorax sp. Be4]
MAEKIGEIYYAVTLDTAQMIDGQRKVDRELKNTTGSLDAFGAKLTAVASAIGAYAAALYLIRQSDAFTKMNAQLKLATESTRELAVAQADVRRIAKEAQTDISGVATLYARITNATKELGTSQAQVAAITRTVALALKVSGAGAAESASATLQLSQAFASGVLRGEEFNAVSEAAPRLMKALADGMGVPIGQLRGMAEQGKLTSDVLANALPKALQDLEQEAKEIQTISGAFQQLSNELMLFIGQQTTASGSAKLTADAIGILANNLDLIAAAAIGFAATKLAGVLLAAGTAATANTVAMIEGVAAQRAAIAASQAAAAAALAESAAKLENMTLTQAMIALSRQELVAKLAATNQTLAQAAAQAAASRAAGAQSFALAMLREAEMTTAAAQASRAAILRELAVLGAQQAAVTTALTAATAANTAAQTANAAALGASGAASTVASRALTAMGGPIGLITTLLGLGVTAWMMWGNSAKDESAKAAGEVEASGREIIASLDRQNAKLRERLALAKAGNVEAAKSGGKNEEKLASTLTEINALKKKGSALTGADQIQLIELEGQYRDISAALATNRQLTGEITSLGQKSKAAEFAVKYASDLERVNAEIEKWKKALGPEFTPDMEQRIRQKIMPDKKGAPKKTADERFDDASYLSSLRKAQASEIGIINETETENLRRHKKLLDEKKISEATYAEAVKLTKQAAEDDTLALMVKTGKAFDKLRDDDAKKAKAALDKRKQREKEAVDYAAGLTKAVNPVDALRQEYQAKLELVTQYEQMMAQAGVDATEQGQQTRTQIATEYELQRRALAEQSFRSQGEAQAFLIDSLNSLSSTATSSIMGLIQGTATAQDAMRNLAGVVLNEAVGALMQIGVQQIKNALLGNTLAAADKARAAANGAVYAASVSAQVAGMSAMAAQNAFAATAAIPIIGPALAPAAAAAAGALATGLGAPAIATAPLAGARQYGGPVSSGGMYRVNETGAPEMFTGSNGQQYMLPTKSGQVTAADKVGGGGGEQPWVINVYNAPPGTTTGVNQSARTVDIAVAQVASQIANKEGKVWSALRGSTNVRSALG